MIAALRLGISVRFGIDVPGLTAVSAAPAVAR